MRKTMAKFDVLDEVIINAKPDVVYKAILSGAFRGTGADFKLLEGSNSVIPSFIRTTSHGHRDTGTISKIAQLDGLLPDVLSISQILHTQT
jgi:hypothetical protein